MSDVLALIVASYVGIGVLVSVKLMRFVTPPPGSAAILHKARRAFVAIGIAVAWPLVLIAWKLWASRHRQILGSCSVDVAAAATTIGIVHFQN